MVILIAIIAVIHIAVYTATKDIIEEQLELSAHGIVVSIAYSLMENIEEYKLFLETQDMHSDYYKKMQAYFANIKNHSNIKYIFTERRLDAETVEFILDAEPIGSPEHSPPGSINPNDPVREAVYSSGIPVGFRLVDHPIWGKLVGAHAPIFDTDGKLLGIAGVNIDGAHLYAYLNRLQAVLLVIYLLITGLAFVILLKYSGTILGPVFTDKLTGAYNKRYFEKLIQDEIATAIKHRKNLALMMLDLDHFKNVNDVYGHGFGDVVLASVSGTIKKNLRPNDHFIRYGGEEFIAMVADVSTKHVLEIAERIRKAVEDGEIYNEENGIPVKITISIGVSSLNFSTVSAKELLDNADKALYNAKIKRNMVSVF